MSEPDRIVSQSLLLLPPPPPLPTLDNLQVGYGPSLISTLKLLEPECKGSRRVAQLDIAIAKPGLLAAAAQSRATVFSELQLLLANLYGLLNAISAKEQIKLDAPGGIDIRIFFLDYTPGQALEVRRKPKIHGPIIDLQTLVLSHRPWRNLFVAESEEGQELARSFSYLLHSASRFHSQPEVRRVPDGTRVTTAQQPTLQNGGPTEPASPHHSVAVGGTFDHLHVGHKLLLTATALLLDSPDSSEEIAVPHCKITIGITGDALLEKKKFAEHMESWAERQTRVMEFMQGIVDFSRSSSNGISQDSLERADDPSPNGTYVRQHLSKPDLVIDYVQISDPFGPTITDEAISALLISKETRAGGTAVNEEREKKEWHSLDIFEVDVLDSEQAEKEGGVAAKEFAAKISSTAIRQSLAELAQKK